MNELYLTPGQEVKYLITFSNPWKRIATGFQDMRKFEFAMSDHAIPASFPGLPRGLGTRLAP